MVTRGAARLWLQLGYAPVLEAPLPNGRRADVMALGRRGEIVIVEVKSSLEDFRTDAKWREYQPFCDSFYFAVTPEFPREVLPPGPGLIVADGFGARFWPNRRPRRWRPGGARRSRSCSHAWRRRAS